jgi:hypothetical protein
MSEIPIEHQLLCEGCGEILDMRDASILSHGWIENGEIVCYTDIIVTYSSSKKVDESIQWTVDKKQINLN